MKKRALIPILLLLCACSNLNRLEVSQIQKLYVEYNSAQDINYGSTLNLRFKALMNSGKEIDVTDDKKFSFKSSDLEELSQNQFIINRRPDSFDEQSVYMTLTMIDKEETYSVVDSIVLNFRGDLKIMLNGKNGENGLSQKDKGSRIVLRDGKNGEDGTDGENGTNASEVAVYIWQDGDVEKILVKQMTGDNEWRYLSRNAPKILIDASGGNGGNGGDGGDGGDGKDGVISDSKTKDPGDGGRGGNGGNGGTAGNGGIVHIYIHPNTTNVQSRLEVRNMGGQGGSAGTGGLGGKPGIAKTGQTEAISGKNGENGAQGVNGFHGAQPVITVVDFDFSTY